MIPELAFGSSLGVDGYFLRHFRLSLYDFIAGVTEATDDHALAQWFLVVADLGSARGVVQRLREWQFLRRKRILCSYE